MTTPRGQSLNNGEFSTGLKTEILSVLCSSSLNATNVFGGEGCSFEFSQSTGRSCPHCIPYFPNWRMWVKPTAPVVCPCHCCNRPKRQWSATDEHHRCPHRDIWTPTWKRKKVLNQIPERSISWAPKRLNGQTWWQAAEPTQTCLWNWQSGDYWTSRLKATRICHSNSL